MGAQDKKRSAMFFQALPRDHRCGQGGLPDPRRHPRLRVVLAARAQSMPKDNIQRAIDKASGGDAENYEEIRYEGFGPGGVSLVVEALTDNRNRTATNVRTISKNGGNLGASGSVTHAFQRLGLIAYPASAAPGPTRCSTRRSTPAPRTSNRTRTATRSGPRRTISTASPARSRRRSARPRAPVGLGLGGCRTPSRSPPTPPSSWCAGRDARGG